MAVTRSRDHPLEALRAPTLVVHGGGDRLVRFADHGRVLAPRNPGPRLVTAADGDHVMIFTHRHLVQLEVCRFLREQAPPAV